jgi:DNA-binding CsgD family transcriptional regulator
VYESVRNIIDSILEYLRGEVSVHLVGMRGSGRTLVTSLVTERLTEEGVTVASVTGIPALKDRPLGALLASGLLNPPVGAGGTAAAPPAPAGGTSIASAVTSLLRHLPQPNSVLIVDDADELDQSSAGVIDAARTRQRFLVLAVRRPGGASREATSALTSLVNPCARLTLHPMHFDQLHSLVHDLLPGTVESATVARIATATGGLPGLVQAVIGTGKRTGAIAQVQGQWKAVGDLYSERLAVPISLHLYGLNDAEMDALLRLAWMGSVPASDVHLIADLPTLARLDDIGVVQIMDSSAGRIGSVFPPLLAEYLRRESSSTRRTLILRELEEAGADPQSEISRWVSPRRGLTVSDSSLLSSRIREYWEAETQLNRTEWLKDQSPQNAVPLVTSMISASASAEEIEHVIQRTDKRKSSDFWKARLAMWTAIYRAVAREDLQGAQELLAQRKKDNPAFADVLSFISEHLQFVCDRVPDVEWDKVPKLVDELHQDVRVGLLVECLIAQGRPADALKLLEQYSPEFLSYADHNPIYRGLAMLLNGQVLEGTRWAEQQLAIAQDELHPGLIQANGYVVAFGLALQGRFHELGTIAASILTLTGVTTLYEIFQRGVMTLAALAAVWDGRVAYATTLADQAAHVQKLGPFPAMLTEVAPELIYVEGEEAGETLWRATDDLLERGYISAAIFCGSAAIVKKRDLKRAAKLAKVAGKTQSQLLRSMGNFILAAAEMDSAALRRSVKEMEGTGVALHVLRGSVMLAMALRQDGDIEGSAEVADEAFRTSAINVSVKQRMFLPLAEACGLSIRELEIGKMLASGKNPTEVAQELDLSVRTVENHVSSTYRKVGVGSRKRLSAAITTWLGGLEV